MEINLLCIHNIADFPPFTWAACTCLGSCTTGTCTGDGEAPWKKQVYAQLVKPGGTNNFLGIILDIKIYRGRYIRTVCIKW